MEFGRNETKSIWLRLIPVILIQYGLAGLGSTIVILHRREYFRDYGLNTHGTIISIVLSVAVFIPHLVFIIFNGNVTNYMPFQGMFLTKTILTQVFPLNIMGFILIGLVWGFFEGFNYVVISKKINVRFSSQNTWLNWGAIVCAILCILIHGMIGFDFATLMEALTTFIFVYGILLIKDRTNNAWGIIFSFVFLWNAF